MRRVLAITTIRSDYDLLSGLYRRLNEDPEIELELLVAGAHLAPGYGRTAEHIERDGFDVLLRLETLIDSDSMASRLKTASLLLQGAVDVVAQWGPDLILYAGDREDTMVGALLGAYLAIPTLHFFGGEHATDGHVDNPVRHAISKLSTAHAVTTESHARRLQAIGEPAHRIFDIGSVALDKLREHEPLSRDEIRSRLGIERGFERFALVIHHPITSEIHRAAHDLELILDSIAAAGLDAFVGYPNTDPGSKQLIEVIERRRADPRFFFYKNLERPLFLSVFKQAELLAGNSSAGISEAPFIRLPVVNVGDRQRSRGAADNIVFCPAEREALRAAIEETRSPAFRQRLAEMTCPYGDGRSVERAHRLIREVDFRALLLKREDPLERGRDALASPET